MPLPSLPLTIAALLAVNLWMVALFWIDKQRARAGLWRVSEGNLLALAARFTLWSRLWRRHQRLE